MQLLGHWSHARQPFVLMSLCLTTLLFIALSWYWLDTAHVYSRDQPLNVMVPVHVNINFGGQPAPLQSSELTNPVTNDIPSQPLAAGEGSRREKTERLPYNMNNSQHFSPSSDPPPGSHGDHQPLGLTEDKPSTFLDSNDQLLNTSLPVGSYQSPTPVNIIVRKKSKRTPHQQGTSEFINHQPSVVSDHVKRSNAVHPDARDRFRTREPCSLPQRFASRPLEVLLCQPWIQELKEFLNSLNTTLVSLVTSDYGYRDVLLNWLISATVKITPPLSNILVLSLDRSLHGMLRSRGITSVHIPPESVIMVKLTSHVGFSQVHIIRLTVMRLINHWGFDVANYDTDAIILKNPEPLYDKDERVDMIGSFGHFPKELYHLWGVAVCIGVVMIRATQQTEVMWEVMSSVQPDSTNDQLRLNVALAAIGITAQDPSTDIVYKEWTGSNGKFLLTVLPTNTVCRSGTCSLRRTHRYYIWHKGGSHSSEGKRKDAKAFWFLRDDWEDVRTNSQKYQWLAEIARL